MAKTSRARVAGIMFFQLFSWGAINPVLSLYLQEYLHFSGTQSGIILAGAMVSSLFSPLFAVYVVDRLISAPKLLMLCSIVFGVTSMALGLVTDFAAFFVLYLLLSVWSGPTIGLVNAIGFHNLEQGSKHFGGIRVWGTIGWIAAGYLVSGLWYILPLIFPEGGRFQPVAFVVSALGGLVTTWLAGGIKTAKPILGKPKTFIPPEALAVLKRPAILVLGLVYLFSAILDRFYFFGTAPFLKGQGMDSAWILPAMSLGQISEIVTLFTLAFFLHRFSYKSVLLLGLLAQAARFILFSLGFWPATLIGITLNGFVFAYVYSAITMYVDEHCDERTRSGVHQLIVFSFSGLSSLLGNLAAGWLQDAFTPATQGQTGSEAVLPGLAGIDWGLFWLMPAIVGVVLLVVTMFAFREEPAVTRAAKQLPSGTGGGTSEGPAAHGPAE